ncbi:MAG: hypothetical protein AB1644_13235 [Candidatus Zixiibacteriota bacterium]
MYRVLLLIFIAILGGTSTINAKHIYLKKTFFGGWKYSTDSLQFKGVGFSGNGLRNEMSDNQDAVSEMSSYKSQKTWALVTGIPGGFLVGWATGSAIAGKFESTEQTMLAVGAPLFIASIVFEATANRHMKRAVAIYNGEYHGRLDFRPDKNPIRMHGSAVIIRLASF